MHPVDQVQQLMLKGKYEQAKKIAEGHLEKQPGDVRMQFNYAWHILNAGNFAEGSQVLDVGRQINVYGMQTPILPPEMIYNSTKHDLEGKVVLFATEGGMGDEIIQARFVDVLAHRGARVIVCATEPMHCLFKRLNVEQVVTPKQVVDVMKFVDYWIPGFSAGWTLGFSYDTLPSGQYLTAQPHYKAAWRDEMMNTNKLKVGIRWEGNPEFEHQQFRRFPVEQLLKLTKYKNDVQLYSLQLGNYQLRLPDTVVDLQRYLVSWEDTAAAIANMDLVISSCTSVAHLAAAMGKPTWVLVPILPYFMWLPMNYMDGRGSPWYRSARLFRQTKYTNWHAPFKQLHAEFAEWVEENTVDKGA